MSTSRRARTLRWSAPLLVAALIAAVALAPNLSASATRDLTPITAQQLIANVERSSVSTLSGTVRLTANLGLPSLSSLSIGGGGGGDFNVTDLLSGTHSAKVWYDGPDRARVALIRDMAENDVVLNGRDLWLWDSTGSTVAHRRLSARGTAKSAEGAREAFNQASPIPTPAAEAKNLLGNVTTSTVVSLGRATYVAGRKVYELELQPRTAGSTVGRVVVAVDGQTWLPLRVEVFAKGRGGPAIELGFTSIHYSRPAASNFVFTPPPGSKVTSNLQTSLLGQLSRHHRFGRKSGPISGQGPDAAALVAPVNGGFPAGTALGGGATTTVGQDWTQVAIVSPSTLPGGVTDLLRSATAVSGLFGDGRLLRTALIDVLYVYGGRMAIGAVTPAVLEAAVASSS